jgi:hypothetical protein
MNGIIIAISMRQALILGKYFLAKRLALIELH